MLLMAFDRRLHFVFATEDYGELNNTSPTLYLLIDKPSQSIIRNIASKPKVTDLLTFITISDKRQSQTFMQSIKTDRLALVTQCSL